MNRKIKRICKYCDDYDELKKQIKKYVYRVLYIDRKHLKKKNCFNERECADKLYQQRFNTKISFAKRQ